ncbi:Glu/Leu/Phe/Val dehydrogenase [Paenibacillus sp. sgz500958]|uniref:Glu/Leu/Phe/Val family dehydrogenase n=1 Tax=Paenibacillus sp. sgz500958 TaxID=3242475 RepID=UPI0036D2C542
MELFAAMERDDYEELLFCQDKASGLKAIIAIHDTTLGPALGGTRMWTYASEEEAVIDALRLAKGMTYKNAVSGLNLGGGKTVIIGNPKRDKNEAMFRAFGRFVQGLNGRYITAEDVGTTEEDMNIIYQETDYVTGTSPTYGSSGNPSPATAYGVYQGMKAAAKEAFGTDSLEGRTIAVQGVGNVAYHLCGHLHAEGAKLIVTDISKEAVRRAVDAYGAKAVDPGEIIGVDCDIYAPCALGATINDDTLPMIKARVVAGAANNQLKEARHGEALHNRGIVYAPDYVINAGGVINIADELQGYNKDRAYKQVGKIYDSITRVLEISRTSGIPTSAAADHLALERIELLKNSRSTFLREGHHTLSRSRVRG